MECLHVIQQFVYKNLRIHRISRGKNYKDLTLTKKPLTGLFVYTAELLGVNYTPTGTTVTIILGIAGPIGGVGSACISILASALPHTISK